MPQVGWRRERKPQPAMSKRSYHVEESGPIKFTELHA